MAFAWLDVCHVEWQFYEADVIRKIKWIWHEIRDFFSAVSVFKIKDRIFCGSYDYELTRAVVSALLFPIPDYWLFVLKLIFFNFILLNQSKCKALIWGSHANI